MVLARATGSGLLPLSGFATAVIGSPVDYSTGRLAFASRSPRSGTVLTNAVRTGRVLNPTRRGKIMEIA